MFCPLGSLYSYIRKNPSAFQVQYINQDLYLLYIDKNIRDILNYDIDYNEEDDFSEDMFEKEEAKITDAFGEVMSKILNITDNSESSPLSGAVIAFKDFVSIDNYDISYNTYFLISINRHRLTNDIRVKIIPVVNQIKNFDEIKQKLISDVENTTIKSISDIFTTNDNNNIRRVL